VSLSSPFFFYHWDLLMCCVVLGTLEVLDKRDPRGEGEGVGE